MSEILEDFSRHQVYWKNPISVGSVQMDGQTILEKLGRLMTDERKARLNQVAENRSLRLAAVLENIYDRGNVSAVMRSFEAFGFLRMHLIEAPGAKFKAANRVTKGAEKWLDVHAHNDPQSAVTELKREGYQVWATDLDTDKSIGDIDWSRPTAIVLGNEKDGVSAEMKGLVDGRFRIPMLGFSQSFNISVAGALIFYHAHLALKGEGRLQPSEQLQLLANYYLRCFDNPEKLLVL